MNRPRWWLVAPALLASAVFQAANAAEIRDKAGIFSPEVVKKAQAQLDRLEKEYDVPVTIETIPALNGEKVARVLDQHAQAVGAEGVYILIAKDDHALEAGASKHFTQYLTRPRLDSVQKAFAGEFKQGNFDAGLTQAVEKMDSVFSDAKADAGGSIRQKSAPNARRGGAVAPARPAPVRRNSSGGFSLLWLIGGGLALFFLFRIIGGIFRAMSGGNQYGGGQMMGGRGGYPGPGGPGYGGGGGYGGAPAGGGFMSSLFGGIGGAMAGNWLYDKMSGGHQGGGYADQTGMDAGAAPVEDASPEWNTSNADATNWGDAGTPDNAAGGDWGGGGGGDWGGGGGGGGDWGGGGGDDNGGSW